MWLVNSSLLRNASYEKILFFFKYFYSFTILYISHSFFEILPTMAVFSNDLFSRNLWTHILLQTSFYKYLLNIFSPKSIHKVIALLWLLHIMTWIQPVSPHYVCAMESLEVVLWIAKIIFFISIVLERLHFSVELTSAKQWLREALAIFFIIVL